MTQQHEAALTQLAELLYHTAMEDTEMALYATLTDYIASMTRPAKPQAPDGYAWQDIASAPKDGRAVILLSFEKTVAIAKWNSEGDSWVDEYGSMDGEHIHHLEVTGNWSSCGGWFQPNEVCGWMPLPAAPSITELGEKK